MEWTWPRNELVNWNTRLGKISQKGRKGKEIKIIFKNSIIWRIEEYLIKMLSQKEIEIKNGEEEIFKEEIQVNTFSFLILSLYL